MPASDLAAVVTDPGRLDGLIARYGDAEVARCASHERLTALYAYLRPDITWLASCRRPAVLEETARHLETARVFDALDRHGVTAAIMKGGALAYTHYPEPWCRTRIDLDLLVHDEDRPRVVEALESMGYVRPGLVANYQEVLERHVTLTFMHQVDVHWEVTNRALFVQRFPARGLLARTRPAPWAGPHARQLDAVDSVIVTCLHHVAHHADYAYLIWWYDFWLQARALDAGQVAALSDRVAALGVASLCAHDLVEARGLFGGDAGALAPDVTARLTDIGRGEPARRLLTAGSSVLSDLSFDLQALPGWSARARLIAAHLFPPPSFMYRQYGARQVMLLPWLYGRRLLGGIVRRIEEWVHR